MPSHFHIYFTDARNQLEKCLNKETKGVCAESVFNDTILKISREMTKKKINHKMYVKRLCGSDEPMTHMSGCAEVYTIKKIE